MKQNKIEKETAEIQAQIDECDIIIAKNQRLHDYLNVINQYQQELDTATRNLETAPLIKTEVFEKIEETLKETDEKNKEITYSGFSYSKESGTIVLSNVQLPEQQTANDFIGKFFEQDYFADALYNGYSGTEDSGVVIGNVTLKMKDVKDAPVEEEKAEEGEVTE
jgi:hypothetical protein